MSTSRLNEIEEKYQKARPGTAEYNTYWGEPMQKEYQKLLHDQWSSPGSGVGATGALAAWQAETGGTATGPSWEKPA